MTAGDSPRHVLIFKLLEETPAMTITRTYRFLTENTEGNARPQVVTVQAGSDVEAHKTVETSLTEGRRIIDGLEVVPQDFEVGNEVYIEWFSEIEVVGGSDEGLCLRVNSTSGWDKELGTRPWHDPEAVKGNREYLVTLPMEYCTFYGNTLGWSKGAIGEVVKVIN